LLGFEEEFGYDASMLSPALRRDMEEKGIDIGLTLSIAKGYNAGILGRTPPIAAKGLPRPDGERILDVRGDFSLRAGIGKLMERIDSIAGPLVAERCATLARREGGPGAREEVVLDRGALEEIGYALLPFTAFGILTGGGATTYIDRKRNRALDPGLFSRFEADFDSMAENARGRPKGAAAAYAGPDGKPGPSYLRLKQRALLLLVREWEKRESHLGGRPARGAEAPGGGFPLRPFHMTSTGNAAALEAHLAGAMDDTATAGLIAATGCDVSRFMTGVQPMLAAFTHSSDGGEKRVFDRAYGKADAALALPGGHGQCFIYLAEVFRALRAEGKRYAYVSNVDNLGALPSPLEIGILAATGKRAGFDFSYRTAIDVKGGILIETGDDRLACGDLGAAISAEEAKRLEAGGRTALFNCATGLFDLDWLVGALDDVAKNLPVRFSDQEKDAGRYSQAEQVTWEVISLIEDPAVFAVEKTERFLAAKMLMETILMCRAGDEAGPPAWETGRLLRAGLARLLSGPYGMAGI
jgi:hypothetical protein